MTQQHQLMGILVVEDDAALRINILNYDQRRIIFPVSDNYNSRKLLQIFVLPKQGKRLDSSEFSSLRVI